ncbi:helix-turn-helix domain-containing protein [Brevibacillus humidisoli]|uniref:helix-turn-helix domain-containing protein n=1 Tax=Brevibacillus humidisoli TaxID=2895522 RepID=UPI001E53532D|nr:helix-turn-helix domain-containing protein [Brevibacillus humidisoli]UFJ41826.1 helix-turn-helix domain-containing protein [Brevibacillus humidisoli]
MEIKVAFVGPEDFLQQVLPLVDAFGDLDLLPLGYRSVAETPSLVEAVMDQVDVLLFAGPIPYQIACETVGVQKPMLYLPHNGTSLYRIFFRLLKEKTWQEHLQLSIDILHRTEIEERLDELGIEIQELYVREYQVGDSAEEILQFHLTLWEQGKIDVVLTCVSSVHQRLCALNVPCYRVIPTKSVIHDCLHRARLEGRSARLRGTQLAIVLISMDGLAKKRGGSEYEQQRKRVAIQQVLIDYGEEIQALMNWTDRDEVTFVTTRSVIERTTQQFRRFPLLDKLVHQLNSEVSIGIGLGHTAHEAETKAREALSKARTHPQENCCMAIQGGEALNLSGSEVPFRYSVRSDDPKRLQLARDSGLSIGTINKLVSFCENRGSSKLTASELASGFGITIRSARRILSKLEQGGIARVVGEEQPLSRGRPRQLYELILRL